MGIETYYRRPRLLVQLREGPLGNYIDLFADRLQHEGHCQQGAWRNLHVVCDFSHWLARKHIAAYDVDEQTVSSYLPFRRRQLRPSVFEGPALMRMLALLREIEASPPAQPTPSRFADLVEQDFVHHLQQDHGLARVSVIRHLPVIRMFLREKRIDSTRSLSKLTARDVVDFIELHVGDHSPRSAQIMCWTLRSFSRFLRYRGYVTCDLAASVPSIRRWTLSSLPTYLQPDQVQSVLDACRRDTSLGRRDYAVLLLLARLGLRSNEVTLLELADINWRAGTLTIKGKGRRRAELPLPMEVGAAVADYLEHSRPRSNSRRVFIRQLAPHRGFASSSAVYLIARMALERVGIDDVASKGPHLFRHSLATQLLRSGASLTQIGQLLRHEHPDTTRIYAKVDVSQLRTVALPWPGGVR
ncbi:site-specific integrase [Paraburkholderia sp. EG287A]|uniref:site-specific integrase n=1 Tax=unclassified Paraburkholderia TaxID=2615204 RepID=UPI0034D194A7